MAKSEGTKCHVKTMLLERIKRGRGIKGREDKSNGIEILITEYFAKISPNKRREGIEIDPMPPVIHYPGPNLHDEHVKTEAE